MSPDKRLTLQEIRSRRKQKDFIGREEQLSRFRENLGLSPDDERRRFIFSISGQGGIGKTTLLKMFRRIAEEAGAATAWSDHAEKDVPAVMARLSAELKAEGFPLKAFDERYEHYRKKRQELEADPEVMGGFAGFLGSTLARTALQLGRQVPVAGLALDHVDLDAAGRQGGELLALLARKLKSGDDVQLIREPLRVLVPLFLDGLDQVVAKKPVVLFLDTYEYTGSSVDPWLRDLLEGRFGDVPADLVFVIGGRGELDPNLWEPFEDLLARFSLEPFTPEEASEFLASRGIRDEATVALILELSGGLPLLVATLAASQPTDARAVGDASDTAVERFLSWIDTPERRELALAAAVPRRLNQDVVGEIVALERGTQEPGALFDWLIGMPFVLRRPDGWVYHDVVRTQMLRHLRHRSPERWKKFHECLASYYTQIGDHLGLEEKTAEQDEDWQSARLEVFYHQLCSEPHRHLAEAVNDFLKKCLSMRPWAMLLAEALTQAGDAAGTDSLKIWGQRAGRLLEALERQDPQDGLEVCSQFLGFDKLDEPSYVNVFLFRFAFHIFAGDTRNAILDLETLLDLVPNENRLRKARGQLYLQTGRFEEALTDFNKALDLSPDDPAILTARAEAYRLLGRFEEALLDVNGALELVPDDALAITARGATYKGQGRFDEALADFNKVLQADPHNIFALEARGEVLKKLGHLEQALEDFDATLRLDPGRGAALAYRWEILFLRERFDEALQDARELVRVAPDSPHSRLMRGMTLWALGFLDDAHPDLDKVIQLQPDHVFARNLRAEIHSILGKHEQALRDFTRVLEIERDGPKLRRRAEAHIRMGDFDHALADLRAIEEIHPPGDWNMYLRALALQGSGRVEEARTDLAEAIATAQETCQSDTNWKKVFQLGLYRLTAGEWEQAEEIYREAIERGATTWAMRWALADVDLFLSVHPGHDAALRLREKLSESIDAADSASTPMSGGVTD